MSQRIFSASDFQESPGRGSRSGGSVVGRVVSSLIGLIVTVPALLLVIAGGGRAYQQLFQQARTDADVGAILLAVAGLVLLIVVVLSGLLSAAGPLVGGIIVTAAGVAFLVDPGLVEQAARVLPGFGRTGVITLSLWCQSGLLLGVGIMLLVSALARVIASRSGATRSRGLRAVVSVIAAVVATTGGLALLVVGSTALLRSAGSYGARALDVPSLLILLAGCLVLGGVALTAAWSSAGSAIVGTILLLAGLAGFLPAVSTGVFRAVAPLSSDAAAGASNIFALAFVAVLGVVLIGAAASAARARRAVR
jgi:hypothetical protein